MMSSHNSDYIYSWCSSEGVWHLQMQFELLVCLGLRIGELVVVAVDLLRRGDQVWTEMRCAVLCSVGSPFWSCGRCTFSYPAFPCWSERLCFSWTLKRRSASSCSFRRSTSWLGLSSFPSHRLIRMAKRFQHLLAILWAAWPFWNSWVGFDQNCLHKSSNHPYKSFRTYNFLHNWCKSS